jgi:hypothetical protein
VVGYSTKDNSWEPRENLGSEASTLIKELIKAKSAVKDRRVAKAAVAKVGANDQRAAPPAKRAAPPTKQVQKKAKAAVNQTPRIATDEENCSLVCSIEQDGHMKEPVTLQCGCNFEKSAISGWLMQDNRCPLCRAQVPRGSNGSMLKVNKMI